MFERHAPERITTVEGAPGVRIGHRSTSSLVFSADWPARLAERTFAATRAPTVVDVAFDLVRAVVERDSPLRLADDVARL